MKLPIEDMEEPDIHVAPLIDMVFLLLVYFMVSASLIRSEADLSIRLPGMLAQAREVAIPDEQMIEVKESRHILINGREFDSPESTELPELVATLERYRLSCEAAKTEALVTISADDRAKHQRVVDVMNACSAAGIEGVSFTASGEGS